MRGLSVVATPIGNPRDITLRALDVLREAEVVIGEERKEVSKLLRAHGIEGKELELLNEHSTDADVAALLEMCRAKRVALVSDAGTPGFCDPGARLVAACRREEIPVTPLPGASSLMCLLSLSGEYLREFHFRGFLPPDRESRARALSQLKGARVPVVLMDTPYRLGKLLQELAALDPGRRALLGLDFTLESEAVWEGTTQELAARAGERKAEFVLLLYPGRDAVSDRAPGRDESRGSHRPPRFASKGPSRRGGSASKRPRKP